MSIGQFRIFFISSQLWNLQGKATEKLRFCALYNMGTTLFSSSSQLNLKPREIEVAAMHFVDGRPLAIIAEWLGLTQRAVELCLAGVVKKYPALANLNRKTRRPKIVHMSQIENPRDIEHAPFNPDEL